MTNTTGLVFKTVILFLAVVIPAALFSFPNNNFTSDIILTVIDGETNEPLYGVNVYTDDLERYTASTDLDGKITVDGSLGHLDILNFSYIGYATLKLSLFEIRKRGGIVKMFPAVNLISDTLVVIGRRDDPADEIPYQVQRIDAQEIAFTNAQNAAEILEKDGSAFVQRSQMGGGSPVIRGFEANRVLLVLDGVRMNNAVFRNGHLQNAITIDNGTLEQVEVIFGPGSLIYGSDALGGVVHYRTRDPKLLFGDHDKDYRLKTNYYTRYATANQEKTAHLDIDYSTYKWGSLTSFSISDFGDLRSGNNRPDGYPDFGKREYYVLRVENVDQVFANNDPNIQVSTGYTQVDFLQKVRFQPSDKLYFIGNFQYSTSTNIPRYDSLTDTLKSADELKFAEWYYGPQKRLFASLKARILGRTAIYDNGTIIAAFQKIDEDRIERRLGRSHRDWTSEDIFVYSITADFDKNLDKNGRNVLSYGGEYCYNYVDSKGVQQSARTGAISLGPLTRYANAGNYTLSKAGYLNYEWKNKKNTFFFNAGGRYTDGTVGAKYDSLDIKEITWPQAYFEGIESRTKDISYAAGFTWNSPSGFQMRMLGSRAFRAPNVDDLFKTRKKDNNVLLPNTDLKPEFTRTGEITLGQTFGNASNKSGSNFYLSGTAFYTQITDMVIRKNGTTPDGSTIIAVNSGRDTFNVQQNFNASDGYLYGWSGNLRLKIKGAWEVKAGINFQKGWNDFTVENKEGAILFDTISPMDHIPPMYGRGSLSYTKNKLRVEGVVRFNGAKPAENYAITGITLDGRTGEVTEIERDGADNFLYSGTCRYVKIGDQSVQICDGNLAWTTLNVYASYQMRPNLNLSFAVENIADIQYRVATSGLSAPGRNFIFALRGSF